MSAHTIFVQRARTRAEISSPTGPVGILKELAMHVIRQFVFGVGRIDWRRYFSVTNDIHSFHCSNIGAC